MNCIAKIKEIDKSIENLFDKNLQNINWVCQFCLNMFFIILTATLLILSVKLLSGFFTTTTSPSEVVIDASYMKFLVTLLTITFTWLLSLGLIPYLSEKAHLHTKNENGNDNIAIISGLASACCYIGTVISCAFSIILIGLLFFIAILPVIMQMNYILIILCSLGAITILMTICAISNKLFSAKN